MQTSEDTRTYDKIVDAIFDKEILRAKENLCGASKLASVGEYNSSIQYTEIETEVRDYVVDVTREVFRQHCAKRLEIFTMRLLDDFPEHNR